jgi:hypothetical protein
MDRCRLALAVAALSVVGACARDDGGRATRQERRQFSVVMESKARQLDRGIAQLADASTPLDSVRAADVEQLKQSQRTLRERLSTVDSAPDSAWPALRDSLESYYRGVRLQYGALSHYDARVEQAVADSSGGDGSAQR